MFKRHSILDVVSRDGMISDEEAYIAALKLPGVMQIDLHFFSTVFMLIANK
jgi:hypothetical protein